MAHLISRIPTKDLQDLLDTCSSYKEVIEQIEFPYSRGKAALLKRRIITENLSTLKLESNLRIKRKLAFKRGKLFQKYPLDKILIKNSKYSNSNLKLRLITEGILKEECYNSECFITNKWNGKKLSLRLNRVNNIKDDNRIENLRLLCPNCLSQIKFDYGKRCNSRKRYYCKCGKEITSKAKDCGKCAALKRGDTNHSEVRQQLIQRIVNSLSSYVERQ